MYTYEVEISFYAVPTYKRIIKASDALEAHAIGKRDAGLAGHTGAIKKISVEHKPEES